MEKIYIASCQFVKSGVKGNTKWSKYKVEVGGDKRVFTAWADYTPFVGQEIEREIENRPWKGQDGKERDSWTIVEPRKGKGSQENQDLLKRIAAIEYRLDELEAGRGANVVAGMREIKRDDIKPEDLPI